jgi:hypothetical protein
MTEQEYADLMRRRSAPAATVPPAKKPKYRNVPVESDGERFDSKLEAGRFQILQLQEKAGQIRDLRAHVSFPLMVGDALIGAYEADAVYIDVATGRKVVEDSKGVRTPLFRWKARHFKAQYGFAITEVQKR